MIKVLHINYYDLNGGAARAGYRIHIGLKKLGVDSRILVFSQRESNPSVVSPLSSWQVICNKIKARISHRILRFQFTENTVLHSLNCFSSGLADWINSCDADIVNLHWLGSEMISIEEISQIKKPIFWTMHDMWPFSGAEHYDDLRFPNRYQKGYFRDNRPKGYSGFDLDAFVWRKKIKYWTDKKFYLISPSHWLKECASKSKLFAKNECNVIHNGVNLTIFNPIDRLHARLILGLNQNKRYILFGAMSSTSDERKGFHLLLPAIKKISNLDIGDNTELLIFGANSPTEQVDFGLPAHYLGHFYDEVSLAILYSAADIFAAPSMQDNLPNTLIEALACGTPCVTFNVGGMPDIIDHGCTGYLAKPFDVEDFAKGILHVLGAEQTIMRGACRAKAEKNFSDVVAARKYLDYYQEILKKVPTKL
jgi:glycosyltransferase involved in cell wall biosynthesis